MHGRMRIQLGISIGVMNAVHSRPPDWRSIQHQIPGHNQAVFDKLGALVRSMGQQTMITNGNAKAMYVIANDESKQKWDQNESTQTP